MIVLVVVAVAVVAVVAAVVAVVVGTLVRIVRIVLVVLVAAVHIVLVAAHFVGNPGNTRSLCGVGPGGGVLPREDDHPPKRHSLLPPEFVVALGVWQWE